MISFSNFYGCNQCICPEVHGSAHALHAICSSSLGSSCPMVTHMCLPGHADFQASAKHLEHCRPYLKEGQGPICMPIQLLPALCEPHCKVQGPHKVVCTPCVLIG